MTKYTTISLIRHGQVYNPEKVVYGRLPGFGLSEVGKKQVSCTAQFLQDAPLAAIYSSPLLRARETAEIIQDYHADVPVHIVDAINEVKFMFEGQPMASMADRNWDLYSGAEEGYEHPADIITRVKPFLDQLCNLHPGQQVALITHGDVIAFTVLWLSEQPLLPHNKHTLNTLGFLDDYPAPASIVNVYYPADGLDQQPELHYIKPYDASLEDAGVSPR